MSTYACTQKVIIIFIKLLNMIYEKYNFLKYLNKYLY